MIDTREPKNGDFIAYVEQLQRESAARLLGAQHTLPANAASASQPSAVQADAHVAARSVGRLASGAAALLLGVALALYWLIGSASIVLLAIAAALVYWGVQRIKQIARQLSPQQQPALPLISKTFGTPNN